jgi:hypothetical protein
MSKLVDHQYFETISSRSCENVLNIPGESIESTQLFEYQIQQIRNINEGFTHVIIYQASRISLCVHVSQVTD